MGIDLLLSMAVDGHGTRTALGAVEDGITFARLAELAGGVAAELRARGVSHLATVGVIGPLLPVGLFGAALAGVPFVPLNYRLPADQLTELLARLDNPLVVADEDLAGSFDDADLPVLTTGELLAAAHRASGSAPVGLAADDDCAVLLFTSGTTSAPKGVVLTHSQLLSYVLSTVEFGAADLTDCQLIAVPPYHVAGVGSALTSTYAGRRVVHLPQFSPADWLATARAHAVTTAMVVPTMLARITDHLDGAEGAVPSLRSLAYGGSRMPRPVLERALAAFPGVGFTNAYGLTETSSTVSVLGPQDHRDALASAEPAVRARLGSVGKAVPGVEIAVRDTDGRLLPAGQTGEILIRGAQVSGQYLGAGSALTEDGWFPTRDLGRLDEAGYLFVEGRGDDTIIRGGENIAPAEIEEVILDYPGVRECVVVGLPDEEWGERIAAFVVSDLPSAASAEDIRAFVRARLRGSKTPDEVHFVDEIPYTATGKVLRRELVAQSLAGSGAAALTLSS
jgi:acyl-CoA synthetase (AMP-forming)/AMP-acid ligase II